MGITRKVIYHHVRQTNLWQENVGKKIRAMNVGLLCH